MWEDILPILLLILVPLVASLKSYAQAFFGANNKPTIKENLLFTGLFSLVIVIFIGSIFIRSIPSIETIIIGLIVGVLTSIFQISFLMAFKHGPMSLTSIIISLSVILPTIYGLLFLNETVTVPKIIGIILVVISIIVLNLHKKDDKKVNFYWLIFTFLAFLACGASYVVQAHFKTLPVKGERNELLFITYLVTFLICIISAFLYKPKTKINYTINIKNILLPLITGLTLGLHNILMLYSLSIMEASLYYPVTTSLKILITLTIGIIFFKDKIKPLQLVGVGIVIVSLVLINI